MMKKYVVTLNGIIEADNEMEAIKLFLKSDSACEVQCVEYENDEHPWDKINSVSV